MIRFSQLHYQLLKFCFVANFCISSTCDGNLLGCLISVTARETPSLAKVGTEVTKSEHGSLLLKLV